MAARDIYEAGFDEENGKAINAETCPECNGAIVTEGGEISCTDCGLIVNEYWIDTGPERGWFGPIGANTARTGAPTTVARHDRGLSTEIGRGVDGKGKPLAGSKRRQLGRLRTQHSRAKWRSKRERNLGHACAEIARLASALELPRAAREEASAIYRQAQEENLILGRSIETITAGSVYATCRCGGYTRTLEEVAEVARCDPDDVRLGYRVLNVELGLDPTPVVPTDLVPRLASACEVSSTIEHRALELARMAEVAGFANGRKPSGVAAAALYAAGRESGAPLTQRAIADVAGVSEATIRQRCYELMDGVDGDTTVGTSRSF